MAIVFCKLQLKESLLLISSIDSDGNIAPIASNRGENGNAKFEFIKKNIEKSGEKIISITTSPSDLLGLKEFLELTQKRTNKELLNKFNLLGGTQNDKN